MSRSLVRLIACLLLLPAAGLAAAAVPQRLSDPPDPHFFGQQGNRDSADCALSAGGRYLVFASAAWNLVEGDDNRSTDVFLRDLLADAVERVSLHDDGLPRQAVAASPRVSQDGRYVVFAALGDSLDPEVDAGSTWQIYLRDRELGRTRLISRYPNGAAGNSGSSRPRITPDGRFVVFQSQASNFGLPSLRNRIWRYRVADGALALLSTVPGVVTDPGGENPRISADGDVVAFESSSHQIVAGDTNNLRDVFVRRLSTGHVLRASVSSAGVQGDAHAYLEDLSADGSWVAFASTAGTLDALGGNGYRQLYLHGLATGFTERISLDTFGAPAAADSTGLVLLEGPRAVFASSAPGLVDAHAPAQRELFLRNLELGINSALTPHADGDSGAADAATDGSVLCFDSRATGLVANDGNGQADVFVARADADGYALELASRTQVSIPVPEANAGSRRPALSANGRYLVFETEAVNLAPDPTARQPNRRSIVLKDLVAGSASEPLRVLAIAGEVEWPSVSDDGRYIAFASAADKLPPFAGQAVGLSRVYRYDTLSGELLLVNATTSGDPSESDATDPHMSADGRRIVFASTASDLVAADSPSDANKIFLWDVDEGLQLVSRRMDGSEPQDWSFGPRISPDGGTVAFSSADDGLVPTPLSTGVMLFDVASGQIEEVMMPAAFEPDGYGGFWPDLAQGGRALVFWHQPEAQDSAQPFHLDRDTGLLQHIALEPAGAWAMSHTHSRPRISPDGRQVVLSRQLLGEPGERLLRWTADDGRLETLYRPQPAADWPLPHGLRIEGVAIADGGRLVFASHDDRLDGGDRNGSGDIYQLIDAGVFVDGFEGAAP